MAGGLNEALLRLQHDAYAVEAALVGDRRLPPLEAERFELHGARLATEERGGQVVGFVVWEEPVDVVVIDRLAVAPDHHRQGIGTALVARVLAAAAGRPVEVSTGRDNAPAVAAYERSGFTIVREHRAPTGLLLVDLRRPGTQA